jgi:hypothetical protein
MNDYYRGISSVLGGFLIHLTLGTFYTLGNVNTYMTSYIRKYVEPNASYASSIWVNAAFMLGQGSLMMLGGIMEIKLGARYFFIQHYSLHFIPHLIPSLILLSIYHFRWTCLLGSLIFR